MALAASFALMAARHAIPVRLLLKPVAFTVICLLVSAIVFSLGAPRWPLTVAVAASGVLALLSAGAAWCLFSELREQLQQRWLGRLPMVQVSPQRS